MSSPTDRSGGTAHRLVLDTNVCLDLFVFGDRQVAALREALLRGAVEAVTNDVCRDEWRRVLGYSQLALDEAAQAAALASYDQSVRCMGPHDMRVSDTVKLPRCADADDQKFLELAFAARAGWLLSKDKEVLRLGRRTARQGWFAIATPAEWLRISS